MYTCYTTFWKDLSKNHISIKQLSKKAITHYVVDSIYKYRSSRNIHIHLVQFFRKGISKVSTLLTRCVHSNLYKWLYREITWVNPLDLIKNDSVTVTRKFFWRVIDNNPRFYERMYSMYMRTLYLHYSFLDKGDDYEE